MLLIVTKSAVRSRVHRRVYMDYIGVKRFDADGKLIGEFRIVGLFTSTAYTRSARSIPYLRRKIDAVMHARRLRPGRPFRQGAGQRAGELSARRAVPDRRGHALPVRAGDPAARRAAARARAAAARPLRPLRLGARLRAARPLRQRGARARSATIWPRPSTAASAPSIRSSRKGRWCACISSSAARPGEAPDPAAADAGSGGRGHRPHLGRRLRRRARAELRAGQGARAVRALSRRVLRRLSRELFAGATVERHPRHRGAVGGPAARRRLPSPRRRGRRHRRAQGLELRPADPPVGARAGAGEHGLPGGRRAHLPDRPQGRRRRRLVPRHGARARPSGGARPRSAKGQPGGRLPGGHDRRGGERRLQRARARRRPDVARRGADPQHLALPAADPRALFAGLHVGDAGQARADRGRDRAPVPRALRSAARPRRPTSARAREAEVVAAIEDALAKVESLDEDRILRHFVNAVQAAIRTNFYQLDGERAAEAADRHQVREPQARRPAAAAAALRDLRLLAARRGRASALRQGRARRHPLVRPAAGFPHRGARAWSRRSRSRTPSSCRSAPRAASCRSGCPHRRRRRRARGGAGRRHRRLQAVHLDAARHHRQSRRPAA